MPRGNILVERIINLLREEGFTYRGQADRTVIYRAGGIPPVFVPRSTWTREERARALLRQAGIAAEQIERFIAQNRDTSSSER